MMFVNATPYPAALPRTVLDEERSCASLVARVTYAIVDGRLEPAPEQSWLVSLTPHETPRGPKEADGPFMKGGVDLYVFGSARAPKDRAARSVEVGISVGRFTRRAVVRGNRHWQKRLRGVYEPSPAVPFEELSLTRSHAFGGTVPWDGIHVAWPENPAGKGFWIDDTNVEGVSLPNLEELDHSMKRWDERPPVCGFGFCPMSNAARFRAGMDLDGGERIREVRPRWFNTAFPPMVAPSASTGDAVVVSGVLQEGPLRFSLPAAPFDLMLRFGEVRAKRTPTIDELGVEVDARTAFVTWRFPFRYVVRRRERREATLVQRSRGGAAAA